MRDNVVRELRYAATEWKKQNNRPLYTGEIDVFAALTEAADTIEELWEEVKEHRKQYGWTENAPWPDVPDKIVDADGWEYV